MALSGLCLHLVILWTFTYAHVDEDPEKWTENLFDIARPAASGCSEFDAEALWPFVVELHAKRGFPDWLGRLAGVTARVTADDPQTLADSAEDTLDLLATLVAKLHLYCAVDNARALSQSRQTFAEVSTASLKVSDAGDLDASEFFEKIRGQVSVDHDDGSSPDDDAAPFGPAGQADPTSEEALPEELTSEGATMDEPVSKEATLEELVSTEATFEEPTSEEATFEEPITEEAKLEEPIREEAKLEEPTMEEAKLEEPTREEAKLEEPTREEAKLEEPTREEAKLEEPTWEEIFNKEATTEEPTSVQELSSDTEALRTKPDLTTLQELIRKILEEKGLSGLLPLEDVKVGDLLNGLSGAVTPKNLSNKESSTSQDLNLESTTERAAPKNQDATPNNIGIKTRSDLNVCPAGNYCAFTGRLMVTGFRADSLDQWISARQSIERKFSSVLAQVFIDSKFGSLFDSFFVTSVSLLSDTSAMVEIELKLHPAEIEVDPSELSYELSFAPKELFYPYKIDHLETSFKLLCSDQFSHCSMSFPLTPELVETAEPKSNPAIFAVCVLIVIVSVTCLVWMAFSIRRCLRIRSFKRRIQNTSPMVFQELEAALSSLDANHLYPTIRRKGPHSRSKASIFDVEREKERLYQSTLRSKASSAYSSSSSFEPPLGVRSHSTLGDRRRAQGRVAKRCQRPPRHTEQEFFLGRRSTTLHRFSLRRTSLKKIASSFRSRKSGSRRPDPSAASSESIGISNLAFVVESSSQDPSPCSSQSGNSHLYATIGARIEEDRIVTQETANL